MLAPPLWATSIEQALAGVAGTERGLSSAEAARRLATRGPNELAAPRRFEAPRELLRYLANPLVLILLVASAVSATFGQVVSAVIIALMLVLSVALNFSQAYRSQQAAARLRQQVGQTATVARDGVDRELPVREVVVGDFLVLFVFLVNAVLKRDLLVFFGFLVVMVVGYLGLMELAKGWFYRRYPM
jgi:Mg2+-importing ATPase